MTDALVEKVARAIVYAKDGDPDFIHGGAPIWPIYKDEARAAILAVLEHFSEPGNVSEKMKLAMHDGPLGAWDHVMGNDNRIWLGEMVMAAMRAARDEVSRG